MTDEEKLDAVARCRTEEGAAAAQRLWVSLGLPTVPEMFREMQRWKRKTQD